MASPGSHYSPPPLRPPPPAEEDLDGPPPARPPLPSAPSRPPAPAFRSPQRAAPKPPSTQGALQTQDTGGKGAPALPGISRNRSQTWSGKPPSRSARPAATDKPAAGRTVTTSSSAPSGPNGREGASVSSSASDNRQPVRPRPPPSRPPTRPASTAAPVANDSNHRPARTPAQDQSDRLPARPPPPPPPGRPSAPPGAGRRPPQQNVRPPPADSRPRSVSTPTVPLSPTNAPLASVGRPRLTRSTSEYQPGQPASRSISSPAESSTTGDRQRGSLGSVTERQNTSQSSGSSPGGRRRFSIRGRRKDSTVEPQPPPSEEPSCHPTDEIGILNRMVVQCVGFLNQPKCLNEEGLFRVPGDMTEVNKLRSKFVRGVEVDLSKVNDPNTVAGLLKLHYRELRFSIVPRGEPVKVLTAAAKVNDVASAKQVMENIPEENTSSLKIFLELLWKVAENSEVNKMTAMNLGQTVGMAIFHDMGSSNAAHVLRFLIQHRKEVFP